MDAVIPSGALPRVRDMKSAATDVQSQSATVAASAPHGRAAAPPMDDRYLSLKTGTN